MTTLVIDEAYLVPVEWRLPFGRILSGHGEEFDNGLELCRKTAVRVHTQLGGVADVMGASGKLTSFASSAVVAIDDSNKKETPEGIVQIGFDPLDWVGDNRETFGAFSAGCEVEKLLTRLANDLGSWSLALKAAGHLFEWYVVYSKSERFAAPYYSDSVTKRERHETLSNIEACVAIGARISCMSSFDNDPNTSKGRFGLGFFMRPCGSFTDTEVEGIVEAKAYYKFRQ